MVTASREGIVELKLAKPVTSKPVKLKSNRWGEVCTLYLSLTDPDSFIAALKSRTCCGLPVRCRRRRTPVSSNVRSAEEMSTDLS
jgi:hypothetical protein